MDFSFSDEQQMLQETTRRFLASEYAFEKRQLILASGDGWSREAWNSLAGLGLLALDIPEQDGGIGAGPVGAMLVAQAAGQALLLEPLLTSAVLATRVISQLGSIAQRERWLPGLGDGSLIAVLAHDEPDACIDVSAISSTLAHSHDDGARLNGRKSIVYHAPAADLLLVTARDEHGTIGVYAIAPDAPGVTLHAIRTVDGQCAADITLDDVFVSTADRLPGDVVQLQAALDYGLATFCAEALGSMERALEATIEYSRSRVQFGKPIGSFQALQHRMADMLIQVEQSRSMTYLAISHSLDENPIRRRRILSGAKVLIGEAARFVSQQAIQLHGGMGMTDELDISHHARRLLAFELRFGTTDEHRAVYRDYAGQDN